MSRTILVIPAYNEAPRIATVVEEARTFVDKVVVIDDGSQDSTGFEAGKAGATVLRHRVNLGKGAALKTGCRAAQQLGAEIIVTIDADGQHPPQLIPAILEYLQGNNLDFVFTARRSGQPMPLIRRLGNFVLNRTARHLFGINLKDIWCGFRAFRADCLEKISWDKSDYSGEIQMALKVGRNGLAYGEYLIPTIYNDRFRGVHIFHGLKLLVQLVIWRIML